MSKTLLIFGATGETGKCVLNSALNSTAFQRIVEVGRSRNPDHTTETNSSTTPRHEFIQVDFEKLTEGDKAEQDKIAAVKADSIICVLGTTKATAGSMEKFIRIDRDYVVAGAKAAFIPEKKQILAYLSSGGADSTSIMPYLKSKGATETSLASIGFSETIVFRPGVLIVPGGRKEHRLAESISVKVFSVLSFISSSIQISTPVLGTAMVKAATLGYAGLESAKIGKRETLATKEIWSIGNAEAERLGKTE